MDLDIEIGRYLGGKTYRWVQENLSYRERMIYAKKLEREWDSPKLTDYYIMKLTSTLRAIVSGKPQSPEDAVIVFDKEERKRKNNLRKRALKDRRGSNLETRADQLKLGAPYRPTREAMQAAQRARLGLVLCADGEVRKVEEVYPKHKGKRSYAPKDRK